MDAPIERVWALLRDFNGHVQWHPAVAESDIEGGLIADQVGCVRRFRLRDGGELREQLLALSDLDHRATYCLLDSPIPLIGYVAHLRLRRVTEGERTVWEWWSSFRTPPGQERELADLVARDIYEAGFIALKHQLRRGGRGEPPGRIAVPATPIGTPSRGTTVRSSAVVQYDYGGPQVMRLEQVDVPPPAHGEVRLRHTAIGLNFIDVYCRTGYFRFGELPCGVGMEAAGVVTDVGPGVHGILVGDRVAYAAPPRACSRA